MTINGSKDLSVSAKNAVENSIIFTHFSGIDAKEEDFFFEVADTKTICD